MNQYTDQHSTDKLREECGVFAAYDLDGGDVSSSIYYGLFALQHRGQQSCGITVSDTNGPKRHIKSRKGMGLINDVIMEEDLEQLSGNLGVGHVRYSADGEGSVENTQPLVLNYIKGTLAIAYNGSIVNAEKLKSTLEEEGAIFQTSSDTEIIAYHIAKERIHTPNVEIAVKNAMGKLKGAYSLIVMSPRKLIGARDPWGFRPLCIGRRDNTYYLASESCALDSVGAKYIRDVEPGEIVTIDKNGGIGSVKYQESVQKAICIFEYIYFARPDSFFDGVSVYESRIMAGRILAKEHPVEADIVIGVPDSGSVAAKGYALETGIPYEIAFMKNSYVGRTFIKPKQSARESSVHIKLNPIKEVVEGKRIVMIDDSIVRGTTMAQIIRRLKDAGATEVHVRISSPPFLYPCYYGTDVSNNSQLIAYNHSLEEICKIIGADSLGYLPAERLSEMIGGEGYCKACFDGSYPVRPEKGISAQELD